ncbi:NADH-quinone oxidoreductase subunit J [Nocardioidaceae bacterium]|nr:NADH-quinone oxidoreductase subunit J [Nocardioidaceae bacterium]
MQVTDAGLLTHLAYAALALTAVAAGVAVFVVDSMARATWALGTSFVCVGLALVLMGQSYLGVITVLMMVMEMAVMAVYMQMFMGMNPALMPMSMVHSHRTAVLAGVGTFAALAAAALLIPWPDRRTTPLSSPDADVTAAMGRDIMGAHELVMLAVGPVMVATVVVGVVLSVRGSRYDRLGDDLDLDPDRKAHR